MGPDGEGNEGGRLLIPREETFLAGKVVLVNSVPCPWAIIKRESVDICWRGVTPRGL